MDPVTIGTTNYGTHWLDRPAADSWFRMVRDGCPSYGITDAGRTLQEQINVFLKYYTTNYAASAKTDQRYWNSQNYWRRPGMPSAATPGTTQARHTFGRALDLNGATKAWVRANGSRYGWIKDLVKGEDWHMEYQPDRDLVRVNNPGTGTGPAPVVPVPKPTPIPDIEKDDDMPLTDADLDKIAVVVASQIDKRLRPEGDGDGTRGAAIAQRGLENIDVVVAGELDDRLRYRNGRRVPADEAGVLISQAGKEELDRMIATRMDERFHLIFEKLGIPTE